MNKPISPTVHGVLDYATAGFTALAPQLFDFPPAAANAARVLAGGYTALSAVTDYPMAVRRMVPFPAHGMAEGAIGLALPALPWILGFADHKPARNFFLGLTAVTAVVAALTDWKAETRSADGSYDPADATGATWQGREPYPAMTDQPAIVEETLVAEIYAS